MRPVGDCVGKGSNEQARLGSNVGEREHGVARARKGVDERHLDPLVDDLRVRASLHEDRIRGGVGTELVEARLAVEEAFGRVDLAGELVIEESAAVIEPLWRGVLCVGDLFRQVAAVGHVEHV